MSTEQVDHSIETQMVSQEDLARAAENDRFRRENRIPGEEREILKRTLVFFASRRGGLSKSTRFIGRMCWSWMLAHRFAWHLQSACKPSAAVHMAAAGAYQGTITSQLWLS
jgi:hypothetical protein